METVLIILAIVWVVIPILAKSKQNQAKEQAERERLARQRAAQAAPQQAERARNVAQPVRTTPLTPNVRTTRPGFVPSVEGVGSQEGMSGAVLQGELTHGVSSNLNEVRSTLTQLNTSAGHVVTASSDSGHAHEETSMSGIDASCPPDQVPAAQAAFAASSAESAFVWDPAAARSGLVLAEILGPCVAMRE